jgi:hypothetical protein
MNALHVIAPYRYLGMWVFDDAAVGLVQEPFVGGAEVIIDHWVRHISNAEGGFRMIFSAEPFPGFTLHLLWLRAELSGNVYRVAGTKMDGWLCPALLKYFNEPPPEIFAKCDALT